MAPAEHVEGESGQVEHEAGHEDRVQGGQDPAHQVQAGGGGETLNEGITKTKTKKKNKKRDLLPCTHPALIPGAC